MLHTHGSGDGSGTQGRGRYCRLCGDDQNLRRLGDTYMRDGVVERYDCLLHDCFGVNVMHSRCMICEQCVHQLRNTDRFRALVHAAFDTPSSDYSSTNTLRNRGEIINKGRNTIQILEKELESESKEIFQNIESRSEYMKPKTRENKNKKIFPKTKHEPKKVNVLCIVCSQRYQMIMPMEGTKNFICLQCKISQECRNVICKRCNFTIPSNMIQKHMSMHSRTNDRRNNRKISVLLNKSSKTKNTESIRMMKNTYEELEKKLQQCKFCGKYVKTRKLLDKHVRRLHSVLPTYKCKYCMKIFKNKKDVQIHFLTHKHN